MTARLSKRSKGQPPAPEPHHAPRIRRRGDFRFLSLTYRRLWPSPRIQDGAEGDDGTRGTAEPTLSVVRSPRRWSISTSDGSSGLIARDSRLPLPVILSLCHIHRGRSWSFKTERPKSTRNSLFFDAVTLPLSWASPHQMIHQAAFGPDTNSTVQCRPRTSPRSSATMAMAKEQSSKN